MSIVVDVKIKEQEFTGEEQPEIFGAAEYVEIIPSTQEIVARTEAWGGFIQRKGFVVSSIEDILNPE